MVSVDWPGRCELRTHGNRLLAGDVEGISPDVALAPGNDFLEVLGTGRVTGGSDHADVGVAGKLADGLEADTAKAEESVD
jgi:hypothetical protein